MVKCQIVQKTNFEVLPRTQQRKFAIGHCLGSKISEKNGYGCGKDVFEDGRDGLSSLKIAGRFPRRSNFNALIKQNLASTQLSTVLEPRHLHRTNQMRPDSLTLFPWAVGRQLLWEVTVVDSVAPCKIRLGL